MADDIYSQVSGMLVTLALGIIVLVLVVVLLLGGGVLGVMSLLSLAGVKQPAGTVFLISSPVAILCYLGISLSNGTAGRRRVALPRLIRNILPLTFLVAFVAAVVSALAWAAQNPYR